MNVSCARERSNIRLSKRTYNHRVVAYRNRASEHVITRRVRVYVFIKILLGSLRQVARIRW